ncbi:MAG: DUF397 domain-containing protein [Frankia sp.]
MAPEEVPLHQWRKSTYSKAGACVEVALVGPSVLLRDSKHPSREVLRFSAEEWAAFVDGVRNGEFDHANEPS